MDLTAILQTILPAGVLAASVLIYVGFKARGWVDMRYVTRKEHEHALKALESQFHSFAQAQTDQTEGKLSKAEHVSLCQLVQAQTSAALDRALSEIRETMSEVKTEMGGFKERLTEALEELREERRRRGPYVGE